MMRADLQRPHCTHMMPRALKLHAVMNTCHSGNRQCGSDGQPLMHASLEKELARGDSGRRLRATQALSYLFEFIHVLPPGPQSTSLPHNTTRRHPHRWRKRSMQMFAKVCMLYYLLSLRQVKLCTHTPQCCLLETLASTTELSTKGGRLHTCDITLLKQSDNHTVQQQDRARHKPCSTSLAEPHCSKPSLMHCRPALRSAPSKLPSHNSACWFQDLDTCCGSVFAHQHGETTFGRDQLTQSNSMPPNQQGVSCCIYQPSGSRRSRQVLNLCWRPCPRTLLKLPMKRFLEIKSFASTLHKACSAPHSGSAAGPTRRPILIKLHTLE